MPYVIISEEYKEEKLKTFILSRFFLSYLDFYNTAFQGYRKMEDPREKTPDHPRTELGMSHM